MRLLTRWRWALVTSRGRHSGEGFEAGGRVLFGELAASQALSRVRVRRRPEQRGRYALQKGRRRGEMGGDQDPGGQRHEVPQGVPLARRRLVDATAAAAELRLSKLIDCREEGAELTRVLMRELVDCPERR